MFLSVQTFFDMHACLLTFPQDTCAIFGGITPLYLKMTKQNLSLDCNIIQMKMFLNHCPSECIIGACQGSVYFNTYLYQKELLLLLLF